LPARQTRTRRVWCRAWRQSPAAPYTTRPLPLGRCLSRGARLGYAAVLAHPPRPITASQDEAGRTSTVPA
jgi:hypothetical protein